MAKPPPLPFKIRIRNTILNLIFLGVVATIFGIALSHLWKLDPPPTASPFSNNDTQAVAKKVDLAFRESWNETAMSPMQRADDLTIIRRLSLALTGSIPSIEEIRAIEKQPEHQRVDFWLTYLLEDPRSSDYLAERFARVFVGVENGPFLIYRRHRLVEWLSDQISMNRPYNELVQELIGSDGIWTTNPAANFITVTEQGNKKGPDEVKLASRTTRAFLGVRIDCVQCHDDKFGDRWKQEDFHQLAAFYGNSKVSVTGVQDDPKLIYQTRFLGEVEEREVPPLVPFQPELLPDNGDNLRGRLATWTTHPENRAFARTTANRVWALLFNRPLIEPIDDIPLDGPFPPGIEILANDLTENGYDLKRLIRIVANTQAFQVDSRSADPAHPSTEQHEQNWAAFPMTRLRPEQVAGSLIQSSRLYAVDGDTHIFQRVMSFFETQDFVKRYGDIGEDEFGEQAGTIPQRLLLMNGKMTRERTKENPFMNASTRIASLSPDSKTAVDTAYLSVLGRRPTEIEQQHFIELIDAKDGKKLRTKAVEDLCWTLLNSTEFSWNH